MRLREYLDIISLIVLLYLIANQIANYLNPIKLTLILYITLFILRPDLMDFLSPALFALPLFDMGRYAINPLGHDYNIYSRSLGLRLEILFGISLILALGLALAIFFEVRKNALLSALIPIIILEDQGIKYLMGGVMRNLTAMTFTALADFIKILAPILPILLLIHPPTIFYLLPIKAWRRDWNFISLAIFMIGISLLIPMTKPTTIKLIKGLALNLFKPSPLLPLIKIQKAWIHHMIAKLTVIPIFLKRPEKSNLIYLLYILIPLFPFIYPSYAMRILYLSFYPFVKLLKNRGEEKSFYLLYTIYCVGVEFSWKS